MIVLGSDTQHQIPYFVEYWEDSPAAQRLLKRQSRSIVLGAPLLPILAGLNLFKVNIIDKKILGKFSEHHAPSVLLHELRHSDQITFNIVFATCFAALTCTMRAAGPVLRQEPAVTQLTCSTLGAYLFYQFLTTARSIQEADARAFVARCLLEKNVPFDLDGALPLDAFYPKLIVTPQKTSVTPEQNAAARQHRENNEPGSPVSEIRQSWRHSEEKGSYDIRAIGSAITSGFLMRFSNVGVAAGVCITLGYVLPTMLKRLDKCQPNRIRPLNYIMEKIAAATIPEYNP